MSRVMVVTGASRGLGAAVAVLAGKRGYDVCVNYLTGEERAKQVVQAICSAGRRAIAVRADVAREDDVEAMFRTVDAELGPLNVLVNNAGWGGKHGRVDALSNDDIKALFELNVNGTMLCAGEAIRRMSAQYGGAGGSIINFSSAAARLGAAGRNVYYAASKGAINALTVGLAREVAAEGIRVNAVSPGVIDTDSQTPGRVAEMAPTLPMRRAGQADEVANAVLWLASEEASYVTGVILDVSGAR